MTAAAASPGANRKNPLALAPAQMMGRVAPTAEGDPPDCAKPVERAVTAVDVRTALAGLSIEHRQVIVEMYFHGRTLAEIADLFAIPAGSVRRRAYYGLRQLRRVLLCDPVQAASEPAVTRSIPA